MNHCWCFPDPLAKNSATALVQHLDLVPAFGPILARMGIAEEAAARQFLFPRLRTLGDPFAITGVGSAADRILLAVDAREKVVLYGDYDVDGVTSVAILYRVLKAFGADVCTFLPHRLQEGYGLSEDAVQRCLATCSPRLLVALDCGTAAADTIGRIESQGIDVIVVDHHEACGPLPYCRAFVNPKTGADYHYLCTAGLVFKLCHGLLKRRQLPGLDLKEYLDLVAIATVADLVPLIKENRTFVHYGLRQLERTKWIGLESLTKVAGVSPPVRPGHVSFRLGPRLNAAGRVGVAQDSLDLLLAQDKESADVLARNLDWQNQDRQTVEQRTLCEALQQLSETFLPERDAAIVVASRNWHPGVVGIVASRLMKEFHRPALVIGFDDFGQGKGSGRSVPGFSLVKTLEECAMHLVQFGGHEMAAGVKLEYDQFASFSAAFREVAKRVLTPDLLQPRLEFAAELSGADINLRLLYCHEMLQPFGMGNPQPLFCIRSVAPAGEPKLLKDKHRLFRLRHDTTLLSAIHFNGAKTPLPEPPWDVAFYLESNSYQNRIQLQLQIEAIRSAEA